MEHIYGRVSGVKANDFRPLGIDDEIHMLSLAPGGALLYLPPQGVKCVRRQTP